MAYKLIGQNYQTPDLIAKVTGRSKYAEDFRADGMLFTKLLLSPMPHARVRHIDASEALKLPGVHAILTADEMPVVAPPTRGVAAAEEEGPASKGGRGTPIKPEPGLTNEPVFHGQPILAVAAIDELTAAEAIERIKLDLEPLPFCVDPLESLRPGGPNARTEGNVYYGTMAKTLKWSAEDWKEVEAGRLPMREAPDTWKVGDVDAGFKEAAVIIDETVVCQSTSHQCMEPRTSMAYWQNGKLFLHASAQSTAHVSQSIGNWSKVDRKNVVLIGEYVGGGFGGKNPETQMHSAIPALLAKKTGRPVMMRITREDDHFIGRARSGLVMRVRMGFRKDGRMVALDMFVVQANGPLRQSWRLRDMRGGGLSQLHAAEHAVPRNRRIDQYPSAWPAAGTRRRTIDGDVRAPDQSGGAQAGNRRRGDPQDQCADSGNVLWRSREERIAAISHQCICPGGAGSRR